MSGKGIDNSPAQVPGNDGGYVIVLTRWNDDIVSGLLKGALQALADTGIPSENVRVERSSSIEIRTAGLQQNS